MPEENKFSVKPPPQPYNLDDILEEVRRLKPRAPIQNDEKVSPYQYRVDVPNQERIAKSERMEQVDKLIEELLPQSDLEKRPKNIQHVVKQIQKKRQTELNSAGEETARLDIPSAPTADTADTVVSQDTRSYKKPKSAASAVIQEYFDRVAAAQTAPVPVKRIREMAGLATEEPAVSTPAEKKPEPELPDIPSIREPAAEMMEEPRPEPSRAGFFKRLNPFASKGKKAAQVEIPLEAPVQPKIATTRLPSANAGASTPQTQPQGKAPGVSTAPKPVAQPSPVASDKPPTVTVSRPQTPAASVQNIQQAAKTPPPPTATASFMRPPSVAPISQQQPNTASLEPASAAVSAQRQPAPVPDGRDLYSHLAVAPSQTQSIPEAPIRFAASAPQAAPAIHPAPIQEEAPRDPSPLQKQDTAHRPRTALQEPVSQAFVSSTSPARRAIIQEESAAPSPEPKAETSKPTGESPQQDIRHEAPEKSLPEPQKAAKAGGSVVDKQGAPSEKTQENISVIQPVSQKEYRYQDIWEADNGKEKAKPLATQRPLHPGKKRGTPELKGLPPKPEGAAKESPLVIERPAILKKETKFGITSDLEPVPTLLLAERELAQESADSDFDRMATIKIDLVNRQEPVESVKKSLAKPDDLLEGQMRFRGFQLGDSVDQIPEELAEQELRDARQAKIQGFSLFNGPVMEDLQPTPPQGSKRGIYSGDFEQPLAFGARHSQKKESAALLKALSAKIASYPFKIFMTGLFFIVSLWMTLRFELHTMLQAGGPSAGAVSGYLLINIGCLLLSGFLCIPILLEGWKAFLHKRPDYKTLLSAAVLLGLAQSAVLFFSRHSVGSGVARSYNVLLVLMLFLFLLGNYLRLNSMRLNLTFTQRKDPRYCVQTVSDTKDSAEIVQDSVLGMPEIGYSTSSRGPTPLAQLSFREDPSYMVTKTLVPISFFVSLAVFLGMLIRAYPLMQALSAWVATLTVSVPLTALLVYAMPVFKVAKDLTKAGVLIPGWGGIEQGRDINCVVVDAAELFPKDQVTLFGIKTFSDMPIDEAILDTAALVCVADSVLSHVFDKVIEAKRNILPPVQKLIYEDEMGLSAWVHGQRVLVGNRDLMLHHNIDPLTQAAEAEYKHDHREIIYLGVDGRLMAIFVVGYGLNTSVGEQLRRLEKSGTMLLVKTTDANISEAMIAARFGISEKSVHVLDSNASLIFDRYEDVPQEENDACITHTGKPASFLLAVTATKKLSSVITLGVACMTIGTVLGLVLLSVLALVTGLAHISAWVVLVYELFWILVTLFIASRTRL